MPHPTKGFASMDPERRREICRQGGLKAQATGRAHRVTAEEAREAGKKGGQAVAAIPGHMAALGRKGGQALVTSKGTRHMAEIGRNGRRGNPE